MANREFYYWCRDAVSGIRYWKDRNKVFAELYEHLEDRYASFLEKGYSPETAEKMTLEAMGSATELAPQLAAIHKPYWAYAAIATRVLALALAIHCIGFGIRFLMDNTFYDPGDDVWDPYTEGRGERVAYVQPDTRVRASGYTFSVEKAALWRTRYSEPTDKGEYFDSLYLQLKVTNPLPWMREQRAVRHMWAVDSNGTYYQSFENSLDASGDGAPWVSYRVFNTGLFTYEYELTFQEPSENMQWVELHYDRDGRNMVLRVDLTGGEDR